MRLHRLLMSWPSLLRTASDLLHNRSGTEAIEFAICIVPLLTLVLGGITYAGVIAAYLDITHASGEGARAAIAGVTLCERQSIATAVTRSSFIFSSYASAATVTATVTASQIRVNVSLPYRGNSLTPILLPVPATLSASAIANTDGPEFPALAC